MELLAPDLVQFVSSNAKRYCSVADLLHDDLSVGDIHGAPPFSAIAQFLHIWAIVRQVQLADTPDALTWRLTRDGKYSMSYTFQAMFLGWTFAPCAAELWNSWVPLDIKMFFWLALKR